MKRTEDRVVQRILAGKEIGDKKWKADIPSPE